MIEKKMFRKYNVFYSFLKIMGWIEFLALSFFIGFMLFVIPLIMDYFVCLNVCRYFGGVSLEIMVLISYCFYILLLFIISKRLFDSV